MSLESTAASLNTEQIVELLRRNAELEQRVRWLERYAFGQRSERRTGESADPRQLSLGESPEDIEVPAPTESVRSYQRRKHTESATEDLDAGELRFGENVPVETIEIKDPTTEGLEEGKDYEVISEKTTYRLGQRPSSYYVLKYVRKVVKLRETEELHAPPAPPAVFEKSCADVSLLAALIIDKFVYHLPLYRQHQRMLAAGVNLSRQTLTNLVLRTIELLTPIYHSQLSSILQSKVLAMDETPIKAGRSTPGKMKTAYFWPIYGDKDEVAFPFSTSRAHKTVREVLGRFAGTLLTDGYEAYDRYAAQSESVVHALCWAHTRRKFIEAEDSAPREAAAAIGFIQQLYQVEETLRHADEDEIADVRSQRSREIVDEFFRWAHGLLHSRLLLPSDPLTKALAYATERETGLRVFLAEPNVPLDTNHLERALRPIPLGRKNWLFCWTELGAAAVGRIQSLLATCKLQKVDPFDYLVDVLQRVDSHPVIDIHLLTPRLWKENFAADPLRSDLSTARKSVEN
jgi:transposase